MIASASRPGFKDARPVMQVETEVTNQNRTTPTPSSKTMSASRETPGPVDDVAINQAISSDTAAVPSSREDGSTTPSIGNSGNSTTSTSTTIKPISANSTLNEESAIDDGKENDSIDLETSETSSTSSAERLTTDANEAQENKLSSIVVDPNEPFVEESNSTNSAIGRGAGEMGDNEPDESLSNDQEIANDESGDHDEQQLSRRLFLNKQKPNSISDEIKRLKNQGSKLLLKNPLKRKKSKKKSLIKAMRPRLGTTTADYGNLLNVAYNQQHHQPALNSQVSTTNAISNSIRQHFPSMLSNPTQQLSTTVQKLIMSKLNPLATTGQQPQSSGGGGLQGKRAVHQQLVGSSGYQQQPAASYLENARVVEALSQLAGSSKHESAPLAYTSPATAGYHHNLKAPGQPASKMIPIEIIGLDPSVTNNILQSYDPDQNSASGSGTAPSLVDSLQLFPSGPGSNQEPAIYHHQDSSGQEAVALAQQLQQLQAAKASDNLSRLQQPHASSILHIHHFHTQQLSKAGGSQTQMAPGGLDPADSSQMEVSPVRSPSPQQQQHQQAQRGLTNAAKITQQKVYVNDKGQLVYLSVEDQSGSADGRGPTGSGEQQQDSSAEHQASDGQAIRPSGDTSNQLAELQQQEYQQTQQEYAQQAANESVDQQQQSSPNADAVSGNQQETHQADTINLTQDQPISIQTNGALRQLMNQNSFGGQQQAMYSPVPSRDLSKLQIGEPKQQRVYLTTGNGQTISLIGGRANSLQANEAVAVESDEDRQQQQQQQLLMVSYKPKQQLRNITNEEPLSSSHRNPYNEGQESKASLMATNHLLAAGPQLLKGGSLMLRPFPAVQLSSVRFPSQQHLFSNISNNQLDNYTNELMRVRQQQQQQPINISDLLLRLNGSIPMASESPAHLEALRTGNGSLLLHGMLFNPQTNSSLSRPTGASPMQPVERIPLTIIPIHQAMANMSQYQLGAQLQTGQLSPPLDNRVPFTNQLLKATNPMADSNNNIHQFLTNNHSRPIELASVPSSWMVPDGADKFPVGLHTNGYGNKALSAALMALKGNGTLMTGSGLTGPLSQNLLIENLTFLKHLKDLRERLRQAAASSSEPPSPPLISHHHLLSLNSTSKLSSDDLSSLLNELRLSNGTTINLNPTQHQSPNLSLVDTFASGLPSALDSIQVRPSNKFGQPQSSSPAPQLILPPGQLHITNLPINDANSILGGPVQLISGTSNNNKYIRSKLSGNNNANQSIPHNGLIGSENHQRLPVQKAPTSNSQANNDHRTAMESQQSDVAMGMPATPTPNGVDKHHRQVVSLISDDSEFIGDSNGLGTIALAFIFISLITLTILAVSMIYRHKRRSVARCADLPSRSRLNLTQRTKHFVRSNFVNPGDVTSIKSINCLNSGGSSSSSKSIQKRSLTSSGRGKFSSGKKSSGEPRIGSPASNDNRTQSENRYLSKKPFGQSSLSTFNTNPQLAANVSNSDKYHFSSNCSKQSSEITTDSATDIKTLNTRLQKPTYLKSLISTPDYLLWNKKQQAQSNGSNRSECDADPGNAFYLNIRNQPGRMVNTGKQGASKPESGNMSEASCKLSPTSKRLDGSTDGQQHQQRHQYGSPVKEITNQLAAASYRQQQSPSEASSRQQAYSNRSRPSTTMSTIHSIRDSDTKSGSASPPSQIKRQVNIVNGRLGKLNNLPAPKHLVAGPLNSSNAAAAAEDRTGTSNQIDRL